MVNVDEEVEGGKERGGGSKPSELHFDEEDSEARAVLRSVSSDSSSSSSAATVGDAGDHVPGSTAAQPENVARIPPISPLPPGYDPNRIPAAVFATRPSNPSEWSVASNESLFSIHVGNSSFSRDHPALLLYKSGELTKLDEVFSVPTLLPTVSEGESLPRDSVGSSVAVNSSKLPSADDKPLNLYKCEPLSIGNNSPAQDNGNSSLPGEVRNSTSLSYRSDGSVTTTSNGSFAFPRLVGSGNNSVSADTLGGENTETSKEPDTAPAQSQQQNHRTSVRAAFSKCFSFFTRCSFRCPFWQR